MDATTWILIFGLITQWVVIALAMILTSRGSRKQLALIQSLTEQLIAFKNPWAAQMYQQMQQQSATRGGASVREDEAEEYEDVNLA